MLLFVEGLEVVVTSVSFDLKDIVNFRVQRVMVDLLRRHFWHGNRDMVLEIRTELFYHRLRVRNLSEF